MRLPLVREVRSELTRSRRKGVLLGWFGLTLVFALLVDSVMFGIAVDSAGDPTSGPGVALPGLAELQGPGGLTAGLGAASTLLGVVTLAFWAVLTATDHSSGLVRLLVAAQPRRWRLLVGKVLALASWTVVAATVALAANLAAAPAAARAAGIDTSAWEAVTAGAVVSAWGDLLLSLLVWGVIGLVLATLARSAAIAVSVGTGYVLVVEGVVGAALSGVADRLPGAVLTALAQGGAPGLSYGAALGAAAAYVVVGLGLACLVVTRRDVTD